MFVHYVLHVAVGGLLVAAGRSRRPLLTAGCIAAAGAAVVQLHLAHADQERSYHARVR